MRRSQSRWHPRCCGVGVAVALAALVGLVVRRRWRDRKRFVALQRLVNERLSADPALVGCTIRARVHRGWLRDVEVDLRGEVPSLWQRYAARRVVERELARRRLRSLVLDRVTVTWRRPVPRHERSA